MIFVGVINLFLFSRLSEALFGSILPEPYSILPLPLTFETLYFLFRDGLFDGQSIGKKLVGLRVVNLDGNKCTFKKSFLKASKRTGRVIIATSQSQPTLLGIKVWNLLELILPERRHKLGQEV